MSTAGRQKLRTRRTGSNSASDKYISRVRIEDTFQDLALFIAHTGFSNVRKRKMSDIIPIFVVSMEDDIGSFLRQAPSRGDEIICGFAFNSLDVAWQIFQQNLVEDNSLCYILDELRFILYIRGGITQSTFDVITDQDIDRTLGPMYSTFRPDRLDISIDLFISRHVQNSTMSSTCVYNALYIMFPRYIHIHELSSGAIANRIAKFRRRRAIIASSPPLNIRLEISGS